MCEKGVDRVTGEINTRTDTKDDVKNLSSHIREKLRNGGTLTDQECRVANQLGIDVGRKTSYGKSRGNIDKPRGWKVGDPIDNLTKAGKEPSWSTVKARYWKNEAYYNPDMYSNRNIALMEKGKAPRHNTIDVPKELHHINGRNIDNPHNIDNLLPVWPWEHAEIDPYRHYTGPRP